MSEAKNNEWDIPCVVCGAVLQYVRTKEPGKSLLWALTCPNGHMGVGAKKKAPAMYEARQAVNALLDSIEGVR